MILTATPIVPNPYVFTIMISTHLLRAVCELKRIFTQLPTDTSFMNGAMVQLDLTNSNGTWSMRASLLYQGESTVPNRKMFVNSQPTDANQVVFPALFEDNVLPKLKLSRLGAVKPQLLEGHGDGPIRIILLIEGDYKKQIVNPTITQNGVIQASRAGDFLKSTQELISMTFVSDLIRSRETLNVVKARAPEHFTSLPQKEDTVLSCSHEIASICSSGACDGCKRLDNTADSVSDRSFITLRSLTDLDFGSYRSFYGIENRGHPSLQNKWCRNYTMFHNALIKVTVGSVPLAAPASSFFSFGSQQQAPQQQVAQQAPPQQVAQQAPPQQVAQQAPQQQVAQQAPPQQVAQQPAASKPWWKIWGGKKYSTRRKRSKRSRSKRCRSKRSRRLP
jgi:hypothetical protein